MAVAPSSWGWRCGHREQTEQGLSYPSGGGRSGDPQGRNQEAGAPSPPCHAHLEVLLHLLVHLVQGAGPVLKKEAGFLVPLAPLLVGVLIYLLVGQAQCAQGLLGKGLGPPAGRRHPSPHCLPALLHSAPLSAPLSLSGLPEP